jgi:hypothetical protein
MNQRKLIGPDIAVWEVVVMEDGPLAAEFAVEMALCT